MTTQDWKARDSWCHGTKTPDECEDFIGYWPEEGQYCTFPGVHRSIATRYVLQEASA
jgi:hypothetical protein